ncbi:ATPase [Flexivirga endophytica]|uniref:ATPase n=1 Tax=Flexivirga endophytica TaxID=1849103 RepID=A0A916SV93_9MICO|nr:BadF/BadG/BcrA/BcrD ATPase family protein [Flexivirga endophytica]GGB18675.1 ATPase [Flexivirga endophytica]GHB36993.1 ATPase [Flexivirga endophytica]
MLVGIDVGGTKTHIAVQSAGETRHQVLPTPDWQRTALDHGEDLKRLVSLVPLTGEDRRQAVLVLGAHGCDSTEQVERVRSRLKREWPGRLDVVNDAELLAPAAGFEHAICVVGGTGSIVVGRTGDGEIIRVGGHGWLLDDFGSSPGLAREAVVELVRATDRGLERDGLAERFFTEFDVSNETDLVGEFTAQASIRRWAQAGPLVFEAADAGSQRAKDVIARAGAQLAWQIELARTRGAVGDVVIFAGGVLVNRKGLVAVIERELHQAGLHIDSHILRVPPVTGALELARRISVGGHEPAQQKEQS